ncbi:hypothetical protein MJO28_009311 [Puccinia striiformis f. sp. tritici]|uniref:DNA repair protein REV1 n=2 Tax=Puccinia striiformis TaxID=27350 RepID=A0A2S4VYZ9_9BASI|nr:hypothetical protein MJO28_009311 [Puccinia striiformis f. sp. tritici]KAI7950277.1 hypothetical protein MJO29_008951 [Puccinia striiformis f. sp. tritici]POW14740.1 hypothetical protein PSTT_02614 [Puccinia striiformis]
MAIEIIQQQPDEEEEDIIISDDEFDSILATMPLPGLPPSDSHPHQPYSSNGDQLKKRKAEDTIASNTHHQQTKPPENEAYEPIKFGEISKYMNNKRKKLKLQESALRETEPTHSARPQIFSGLVIHVNGHTNPPLSEIRSMIILHGGTYMAYLDHKSVITHILASSLTPKKRDEFRAYKVVKPEWIVRCVSAGQLLNWSDFRLLGSTTERRIAEGEATGGQAIPQRNLFDFTRDSARSTQRLSPQITSSKEVHHSSSLSGKSNTPKRTIQTVPSSIQSTLKLIPTRTRIENTRKETSLQNHTPIPTTNASRPTHSPLKNQSNNPRKESTETPAQMDSDVFENHPAELPNLGTISCCDPNFITTYFQQSRLHHLSTWKADLLQRVSILSENKKPINPAGTKLSSDKKITLKGDQSDRRVIMHVDFDCFFISAGLINQPELRGKPLAVCHAKASNSNKSNASTSEIASCSYEARAFGVRNGQTLGKAKELCPEIQTMAYDFKLYEDLSLKFYKILLSYADELQAVSVDECLIDVSSRFTDQFSGPGKFNTIESLATKLAEEIRTTVRKATQCEVSIGISYNVLLAKLATKKAKPSGSCFLDTDQAHLILKDLSIDDLPGFGWSQKNEIDQKLEVNNLGDLQRIPLSRLVDILGPSRGKTLHQYALGIDDRALKSSNHERKSVSAVVNYGVRFKKTSEGGNEDVQLFLRQLGLEVSRRLNEVGVSGRQLTLKIMKRAPNAPLETKKFMGHGICEEFSKATKLSGLAGVGISDGAIIGTEAWKLLQSMNIPSEDLRGIGIQINQLDKLSKNKFQSTLGFQTTKPMEPPARRQSLRDSNSKEVQTTKHRTPTASTSKKTFKTPGTVSSTPFAIPPASQLDLEVVEALPTPLKSHILKNMQQQRQPSDPQTETDNQPATIDLVTPDGKLPKETRLDSFGGLPSISQVDWKILAELPLSVRQPIEAIYAQRKSRSSHLLPPPTPPNFVRAIKRNDRKKVIKGSSDQKDRFASLKVAFHDPNRASRPKSNLNHRVTNLGPSQKLINKKTFKLITKHQQPSKIPSPKETEVIELLPTPNKISDDQLEALEIDVRFFRELEGNSTRSFQLDLIWNQFQLHSNRFKEVTLRTDRWKKWRNNFDKPSRILQIKLPEPPSIAAKGDGGGRSKKGLHKLEDVLELIEQWIVSSVPNTSRKIKIIGTNLNSDNNIKSDFIEIDQRDLSIIQKFLIDLIDPPPPTNKQDSSSLVDDGIQSASLGQDFEKLVKIVLWWEDLIFTHFASSTSNHLNMNQNQDLNQNHQNHNSNGLEYWRNILDNLKRKINVISCRDFGAPIY